MKRIVLATDLQEDHSHLFAVALRLATVNAAELVVVHHHDADHPPNWHALPTVRDLLERWGTLPPNSTLEQFQALGLKVRPFAAKELGDRVSDLIARIHAEAPDLLIMGTEGRAGLEGMIRPSIAQNVARRWGGPTLILRDDAKPLLHDDGMLSLGQVLIPIDDATDQQPVVQQAEAFLTAMGAGGADFTLLRMGDLRGTPTFSLPQRQDWSWHREQREGGVVRGILDQCAETGIDLVVMGTGGHDSWIDALQGSKTERVVREAPCAVLVVPVPAATS